MDALAFLSGYVPLFSGLSEEDLTPLAAHSALKQAAAGQTILRGGMTVDGLFIVITGRVEIHAKVPGKGVQRVAELGQGEVFGEMSILERSVAGATAKAGESGAVLLMLPEEPFRRLVGAHPEFARRVRDLVDSRREPPEAVPA